jgi:hypothetical protein
MSRESREKTLPLRAIGDGLQPFDFGPLVVTGHGRKR